MSHSLDNTFNQIGSWFKPPSIDMPDSSKTMDQTLQIKQDTATDALDSDSKRKKISKKRLGTKQLQIPLSNVNQVVNTTTNTGVNS